MSVQKIIAEADKFLDKGKIPEAVEKLKAALQAEPMNQLATTKLANAYAAAGSKEKAAATFTALANRLSEAGKAQVAIAVYKQAIELTPGDIALKLRYAQECEGVGKLSDAQNQAQGVFQYYLRRKKYFDAANILPMLVRLNGKDERLKQAWLEVMQLSQAEKKLVHLLVALAGPPGLVSAEFSVGGEPAALSESTYEGLKKLVPFFPRDAKVAYAAAWCAYRRDQYADFFHYLRECLRREPDFCLGILLFARVLAEKERLNEAYFVFKFLKERLAADKSTDEISTLNQLIDAFVEKNGWISFVDQTDDQMVAAQFVSSLRGEQAPGEAAKEPASANLSPPETFPSQVSITIPSTGASSSTAAAPLVQDQSALAPAEIELGLGSDEMEIQHHSEKAAVKVPQQAVEEIQPAPPAETTGGTMIVRPGQFATDVSESVSLSLASADEPPPFSKEQAVPEASQGVTQAHTLSVAPEPMPAAPVKSGFDPLAGAIVDNNPLIENTDNEKTQIFSPMDLIGAASQAMSGYDDVKTKFISVAPPPPPPLPATYTPDPPEFTPAPANIGQPENAAEAKTHANPTSATMPSRTVGIQAPADEWHALKLDGAQTDLFSPMDVLQAQTDSRPNSTLEGGNVQTKMVQEIKQPRPVLAEPSAPVEVAPSPETGGSHGQGFMPIPPPMDQLDDLGLTIDMGDDLLDGATRILLAPSTSSATQNLLKEIQQDISKAEEAAPDPSMMLRKAERFIAKRNYYLARKALRHAQALGADEELVKKRLGEIRRLELPNSLYQAISSDEGNRERSSDILERLEQEFEISEDESANKEIENSIEAKLETIFKENDPRTILDFGVGLHEMGLYKQAEIVFARIVEDHPDFSFDAYYLAAVSKFSRKDYAGAVSILKKLSIDGDKTEQEKIQIYYALGELFEKMSQSDRSKEFFRKVAELDANYRNIRHKLEE